MKHLRDFLPDAGRQVEVRILVMVLIIVIVSLAADME